MSIAVNKTTFQVLKSVNTPDYPTSDWLIDPASLSTLQTNNVPVKYWKLNTGSDDIEEMTAGEKETVDDDATNLAAHKEIRYKEILDQSEVLATASGFTYDSIVFDMDKDAREKWLGLAVAQTLGILAYPQVVGTKTHDQYSIPDATAFVTFFGTGLATYKAIKEAGSDLKKTIYDATTRAAVDAVVDNR